MGYFGERECYELWANWTGKGSCAADIAHKGHFDFLLEDGWGFPDEIIVVCEEGTWGGGGSAGGRRWVCGFGYGGREGTE